jgi:hypothetical protein
LTQINAVSTAFVTFALSISNNIKGRAVMLIRNILVVIDPTKALKVSEQGAYAQGLKTAVITGASMQLLTCLETPASDEILQGLGSLVTQASAAGVTANSRVEMRRDWPPAIVEWVK